MEACAGHGFQVMRAFVAIDLPTEVRAALARQQAEFRAAARQASGDEIRWTRPEGIHLTLKFLGEISDLQADSTIAALQCRGMSSSFTVELKGFGFFPDARRPRVFWSGVTASPALAELARSVESVLATVGFAPEDRPFRPHLTLARIRNSRPQPALEALIRQQGDAVLGRFAVSEFFLFESTLAPSGAVYRTLARFSTGE